MRCLLSTTAPLRTAVAVALGLLAGAAQAQTTIPAGASQSLAGGTWDLACTDLTLGGSLDLGGGHLTARSITVQGTGTLTLGTGGAVTLAGDWANSGTVTAAGGTVSFVDDVGCATPPAQSAVSGNTTFDGLSIVSSTGKLIQFTAGSTQTVTGALTLQGQPGTPLRIESTTPGTVSAAIELQSGGTQSLANLAVRGMSAPTAGQWLAPGQTNQGAGPVRRWFGTPDTAPIPTLTPLSLAGLGLALAALAARRRRKNTSTNARSHLS